MKGLGRIFAAGIVAAICGGCISLVNRFDSRKPYVSQEHPYEATAGVWTDCICAPWKKSGIGLDNIWKAVATVTWPLWVIDEIGEAAVDTIFLPVDLSWQMMK